MREAIGSCLARSGAVSNRPRRQPANENSVFHERPDERVANLADNHDNLMRKRPMRADDAVALMQIAPLALQAKTHQLMPILPRSNWLDS